MKCPKCGAREMIVQLHALYFPNVSQEESDRRNFAGAECMQCGYKMETWEEGKE